MGRATRQGACSLYPVHRIWRVLVWLTIGVRPVITQLRTGEVPAYFPEGSFIWQATRQRAACARVHVMTSTR